METRIRHILLVDDNANDRTLIKAALADSHLGNDIVEAEDSDEALDYLYKRGKYAGYPDNGPLFILLDIKMTKKSGIELLKIIRADPEFNNIPVIMLTSSRNPADLQQCFDEGANSYAVKPVNICNFMKVVKDLGHYWVVVNKLPD